VALHGGERHTAGRDGQAAVGRRRSRCECRGVWEAHARLVTFWWWHDGWRSGGEVPLFVGVVPLGAGRPLARHACVHAYSGWHASRGACIFSTNACTSRRMPPRPPHARPPRRNLCAPGSRQSLPSVCGRRPRAPSLAAPCQQRQQREGSIATGNNCCIRIRMVLRSVRAVAWDHGGALARCTHGPHPGKAYERPLPPQAHHEYPRRQKHRPQSE